MSTLLYYDDITVLMTPKQYFQSTHPFVYLCGFCGTQRMSYSTEETFENVNQTENSIPIKHVLARM